MPARERAIGPAVSRRAGGNIRRQRLARKWTLTEMSFRMTEAGYRMSPAIIRQVENGVRDGKPPRARVFSVDEAFAFAEVLGVPVMTLLEDTWEDMPGSAGSGGSSPR
jgi:transcriptional regulator with XRE-family HTH domain